MTRGVFWENGVKVVRDLTEEEIAASAPPAPTADDVKAEAGRRILAVYADWKQRNMTMRATELQEIRIGGGTLTAEEETERLALIAASDWVKSMRVASDAIEAMDPIPNDFRNDSFWPENP